MKKTMTPGCTETVERRELRLLLNGSNSYVCTLRELYPSRKEYIIDLERVPESISIILQ